MKLTCLYKAAQVPRAVKFKLLLVMKLTSILLFISALHLSAASFSQTVSLSRKNSSLESVFREIKAQTGYLFFYNEKLNTRKPNVSVELKSVTLEQALDACLKGQDLVYDIVNKTIVIREKVPEKSLSGQRIQQTIIKGTVLDPDTKEPIPGVNVTLKDNKAVKTQTNNQGEFSINANAGDIIVFSYIGYKPKELKVAEAKIITVVMETQVNSMDDVVITGYQIVKKDTYTGNTITIQGDQLKQINSQNILKSIQNFDPSFRILDNNLLGSDPNALPKINVRGATAVPSINDNVLDRNNLSSSYNLPTFILDGFEVSLQKITDLDINRIASVTLLKDAAATAIYGSRAANGVMVITTKAPIPGKLQLTYNYELNPTAPDLSDYNVLNAEQKLEYERLSGLYTNGRNNVGNQDDLDELYYSKLKNVLSGVNTYWLSQPLRNTYGQKHSLYAQGGDSTFRYGVDLRYQTRPGAMMGSDRNQYSGGMVFNYNPTRKLLIKNEVTLTQVNAQNSKYGDFSSYVRMNPYYPMTDAEGNLIQEIANWQIDTHLDGGDQYRTVKVFSPLYESTLGNFDKNSYFEFIDNLSADWRITPDLRFIGSFSFNQNKANSDRFVSPFSNTFIDGPTNEIQNRGSYDYSTTDTWTADGTLRLLHNKQVGDHSFNTTLGANGIASKGNYKSFAARGFSNDKFSGIGFARGYAENTSPSGEVSERRLLGFVAAENYALKDRYLLDASFRLDGSSIFGEEGRFSPFWSLGLGWNIHKESFMNRLLPVISRMRLTTTTGFTGSASFPAYLSKSIYSYQKSNWYSTGVGAVVNGYGNENLKWQKTRNYDLSLDLGLFNDRVSIRPVYYYKLTEGLLTDIDISPSTGFTVYKANLGDMVNQGYEVYLTLNAYKSAEWNVNLMGNLAHNKNKVVKIYDALQAFNNKIDEQQDDPDNNATSIPMLRFKEGQSINTIYAVKSRGIDPENGKEIFEKLDGTYTYDYDIKDTQPVGDETPQLLGSMGGSVTYKQFMLSFSVGYEFGGDRYNQTLVDRVENADPRFNVDARALTEKWQKPGDIAFYKNIADPGTYLDNTRTSSRFVQRYNTINLQSVYLSYDFKRSVAKKLGLQALRPSITANDLFRSSSIEIERGTVYPFVRSVTFALAATF
ncbi:SusC/RagA family TonB-linked outer membrane protein [Pedobacter sp. SAFR-022]|uniref:SusC/RagA family TonB-linked outer membrane protein n=1 Tax=Pedobacter sp. SAFR-022 TaxID=3436861 RepID=UPI003F7D9652